MNKRRVCIITGTRAEYGLFFPILKKIQSSHTLELQIIVSTMHLSNEFGLTYQQIESDGFCIDKKIENLLSADSKSAVTKSAGLAMILLSDAFEQLKPDIVLLLGDRYETHAAANAALLMNIPIAHIHGGEISEGAVDEQIRHSITKMSSLHFATTEPYRQRIIQMGEEPTRVYNSGAPGLDNIQSLQMLSKHDLQDSLNWNFGCQSALFTYHPVTLESDPASGIDSILDSIKESSLHVLFTYANSDECGRMINQKIESFCSRDSIRYKCVKSLGQLRYLSAMKHVDMLIGNTSSGIIEAASFNKPVINIGNRQKGRLRSSNVTDCKADSLSDAITCVHTNLLAGEYKNIDNIYGQGNASEVIVSVLESCDLSITKLFVDKG